MKKLVLLCLFITITNCCFSQDKIGIFKNLNVKTGLTISGFYNPQGDYVYILQQDARVVQRQENKFGGTLSIVLLFPLDSEGMGNLLLNIPIVDAKNENLSLFDSQTPFGLGFSVFPFDGAAKFLGFSVIGNVGKENKLRQSTIDNMFFPIADYKTFNLSVGSPVPDEVLKPFYQKVFAVSVNAGIVIRL